MAISFTCPHCKKPYKLKDNLAGKKVMCAEPNCRKAFTVPAPIGATLAKPRSDAEELAAAAFAEESAPAAVETAPEGAPIKATCRFCDHVNTFDAKLAGKNAPCQNEDCRKIIKVPLPEKTGPKDWRQVERKLPTLARRDTEQIEGAWGNVETAAVSREALLGAGANERAEEPEPPNWGKRIVYGVVAVAVVGIGIWGVLYGIRKYDDYRAGRAMQTALNFEYKDAKTGQKRKLDKAPDGIIRMLAGMQEIDLGRAKDAKAHLEEARGRLEPIHSYERAAALIEVAGLLAELHGSRAESDEGKRIEWDREKLGTAVSATVAKLPPTAGDDGRDMRAHACRVLTHRLAKRNHISGAVQVANRIAMPDEQAEMMAVVGLELLALGMRDKAEELASRASAGGANENATSLIALWMALSGQDATDEQKKLAAEKIRAIGATPGKEVTVSATARIGFSEGLARQGNIPAARELAWRSGKAEDRLRAGAGVAAVTKEAADLEACLAHIQAELKDRVVGSWLLLRLVEVSNAANRIDLSQKFADLIKDPGLKAWAQYEVVRKKALESDAVDFEAAQAVGDSDKLGQAMAIAVVARQKAKSGSRGKVFKEINRWQDEKIKPFGFAGIALANTEWR